MEGTCTNCRREGTKLFLKGERCLTSKCAIIRRNYPPGIHGPKANSKNLSGYGTQLREKQKVKRMFGIREKQFENYYSKASVKKGPTGMLMLQMLELRMDNVIARAGFAPSRTAARQMVSHDFFLVNGKKVNIPSYRLTVSDEISLQERKKGKKMLEDLPKVLERQHAPAWIHVEPKTLTIKILRIPTEEDIDASLNMNLIVEYYSR